MEMNPFENIWFSVTIAIVAFVNVLSLFAKSFIKAQGIDAHFFKGHMKDFISLIKIARSNVDDGIRKRAIIYVGALVIGTFAFVASAIVFIQNFPMK
ncbi:hypothetical protein ACMXYV_06620 [Neptuniibacter sp. SY11_33]|uniref:hypothetical protein n=1 Tax=Neptuniibacter sp. SY11_33 TaxID=3398215 RepID=UPI0039F4D035